MTIIIVDDDEGHAILVRQSLEEAGVTNPVLHFQDGEAALNFLFQRGGGPKRETGHAYLALLDIRMPKVDGIEVLRQIKSAPDLQLLPVIMLTTTDDPREVDRCHKLGCNVYLQKPVDYDKFADAIRRLGMFIKLVLVPSVNGA